MSSTSVNMMLAVNEKKTTPTDLYRPLRQCISLNYSERDAQLADEDLDAVRTLRSNLEKPPDSSPDLRRDHLQSYYKALSLIEPRFPTLASSLSFTWHDAFKPNKKATLSSIQFEKAAVLFNLGAVYCQIALSADRAKGEGIKVACNAFQAAAGAFGLMKETASLKVAAAGGGTVDVTPECAGMLERLMLAQAQECFFEKVIGDGKPPGLCSKVARQVGLYYEEAYAALNSASLNQHFDRTWISHVQLKSAQFYGEACYRYALDLHSKDEIAEEIARLKIGLGALSDAKKSAKGVAAPLLDAVTKLETNMNHNLERAVKENDRVYLQRVPAAGSLSTLPAASLVKPVPMTEVLDASKERMFSGIVPDTSTKALSRYTEMVDDIIRNQAEKLLQCSEMARVRLKEMDLPDSILALEGSFCLPMDLKGDVEAVQICGGPSGLEAELQQLRDLRRVNQELLVQTEEALQKEASEDAQFRTQFGTRWTRPQSSTLTKNLQDRLNRFAGNLKQATDSDARIERAVRENTALMAILDHRPIESALPSLARPIMSLDSNEDAVVGALKQSLRQLENLGAQRAGLEDMLKEMKRKDDILPKLMASSGSQDDLFRKEITKYDNICEEIAQNIEAQENLLLQIQEQNDEFSTIFNLEDYKVSREKCYKQIAAAIAKYQEIKDNINEGLKFYVTLQDAITNVKQQCSDFVMTRNIQCREMIQDVQRQMAGLNFAAGGKTGYNYPSVGQSNQQRNPPSEQTSGLQSAPQRNPPSEQTSGLQSAPQLPSQPQPPYNHPPADHPRPGYSQPQPPYNHPPAEHARPGYSQPYPPYAQQPSYQAPVGPYQHPQQAPSHTYGQPAYPGWHGPYYNTHHPQQGSHPPPPYNVSSPYPPTQGNYYRPQ